MPKAFPPAIRRKIIDFDPSAADAVSISQFCQNLGISRRVFYAIRQLFLEEFTAALHPHSSAPITIHRRYGQDTTRELIRLRTTLNNAGWDYGPISIRHKAVDEGALLDNLPSVAAIARLLRAAGLVESNPKKRPMKTLVRFQRSHRTLLRYLRVHHPRTLQDAARRIEDYRHHYNTERPHQALPGHITPFQAWELIDHAPAEELNEPLKLA